MKENTLEILRVVAALRLLQHIYDQRPKRSTGIYVDGKNMIYGFRTNVDKFPKSFISWEILFGENVDE